MFESKHFSKSNDKIKKKMKKMKKLVFSFYDDRWRKSRFFSFNIGNPRKNVTFVLKSSLFFNYCFRFELFFFRRFENNIDKEFFEAHNSFVLFCLCSFLMSFGRQNAFQFFPSLSLFECNYNWRMLMFVVVLILEHDLL